LEYVAEQKLTANFHCRNVSSISLLGEPVRTASKATTGIRPFVGAGEALANKLLFGVFEAQDEDGIQLWQGLTNHDIARTIGTTEQVVKNYLRNIFNKLGVGSRLELALYVARHGGPK
jgi:Bacterial regulatory proteins, luxR family